MVEIREELHENLQAMIKFAPIIKQLFTTDVTVTISDRKKVVEQIFSNEFTVDYAVGRVLDENEPMSVVMRENKPQTVDVPEEAYGIALRVTLVPICDDHGEVVGCIAVSSSMDRQMILRRSAEMFASSSEEISSSTDHLTASADKLNTYMKTLSSAQSDMVKQIENTEKILEMIHSIAKNTRILGFNAGIEAARSGEHGRGFSVVAKEITKLADNSAKSVNDIHTVLEQFKEKVNSVAAIVKETVEIAHHQSDSISEIFNAIQSLTTVAEDMEELAKKL